MDNYDKYSKILKEIRESKGFTQKDIYTKLHLGKTTYASYEQNISKYSIETLEKLATLLGVSSDYLLGLTDDRRPIHEIIEENEQFKDLNKFDNEFTGNENIDDLLKKYYFTFGDYDLTKEEVEKLIEVIKILKK